MDPNVLDRFVRIGSALIKESNPSHIAAFTIGDILLAEALARYLQLPLVIGRKTPTAVEWAMSRSVLNGEAVAAPVFTVVRRIRTNTRRAAGTWTSSNSPQRAS
jgi:adenine/guanine phosphoribosyltransferase-like PRPP-binding protein